MTRFASRAFFWRGQWRGDRPVTPSEIADAPDRPSVWIDALLYERLRFIACKRGIAIRTLLDEVLAGLPRVGKAERQGAMRRRAA